MVTLTESATPGVGGAGTSGSNRRSGDGIHPHGSTVPTGRRLWITTKARPVCSSTTAGPALPGKGTGPQDGPCQRVQHAETAISNRVELDDVIGAAVHD